MNQTEVHVVYTIFSINKMEIIRGVCDFCSWYRLVVFITKKIMDEKNL